MNLNLKVGRIVAWQIKSLLKNTALPYTVQAFNTFQVFVFDSMTASQTAVADDTRRLCEEEA
jgi:hypothetical protein